ncbi:MAG: Panacea domain-containing protein [Candidatus Flemingiibacterium sp.]
MATVFDTAKYILEKQGRMSTWKLQKLCYYSQAWHIAWTEKHLFDEDFEAWCNGPVCPELFHYHKGKFMVSGEDISKGDISALTEDQRDSIDKVLAEYGELDPYELREQTHSEAPWKNARGNLPDNIPSDAVISKESMGAYYGSL